MRGEQAQPNEFPWQLSLQLKESGGYSHICGAVLYKTKYALTAAHCVHGRENEPHRVVAGLHKQSDLSKATAVPVKHIKIHENYSRREKANDIAILTLASEIKPSSTIKPASIPKDDKDTFENKTCFISGWGDDPKSFAKVDSLRKGKVTILSNRECEKRLNKFDIDDENVCIHDPRKIVGVGRGDSGGPINCKVDGKDVVIGLCSWGRGFLWSKPKHPSVYVRLSEYLEWIAKNTS